MQRFILRRNKSKYTLMVWLDGISTIVGYFGPNPVFTYKVDVRFVNIFCR